jgi:outer membrane protein, heavy metal efflux system
MLLTIRTRPLASVFLLLIWIPVLAAEPERETGVLPTALHSVDELVNFALAASPELANAEARWLAARERAPQARALPDPHLKLGYFLSEVETRVGPQRAKAGISQRFPWFGERGLAGDIAALGAEAAGARHEGIRLGVARKVKSSVAELWYLDRAREITGEQLALVDDLEQVLRARYRSGSSSYAELIRIQLERGKLDERLAELTDRRLPSEARLNAVLGREAGAALPALPARLLSGPALDDDLLRTALIRNNPTLLGLDTEMRRASKSVDLAGKGAYPDLTLGLEFMETGPARMDDTDESGKDPLALTLSINLPIWRGRVNAAEREAMALYRASENRLHGETLRKAAELEQALFDHREALRRRDLYRDELLPQARQGYAVGLEAYRADKLGFQILVDSLRLLYEMELTLARSEADRYRHLAGIEAIAGLSVDNPSSHGVDHD